MSWSEEIVRLVVRHYLKVHHLHLAKYSDDHWSEDPFPICFGEVIWTDGTWIP